MEDVDNLHELLTPEEHEQLRYQTCKDFESLMIFSGITAEESKVAKTKAFHELSSKIIEKLTGCKLPTLFLSKDKGKIGDDVKVFRFFNRRFIYIPLTIADEDWRRISVKATRIGEDGSRDVACTLTLVPFTCSITDEDKLNYPYLGIWVIPQSSLLQELPKLQIDQSFAHKYFKINDGASEVRNLSEMIDLADYNETIYTRSSIELSSEEDIEYFISFILIGWPKFNIESNHPEIAKLEAELSSIKAFQKFSYSQWDVYSVNGLCLEAFVYFPTSKSPVWTIYEGSQPMPKRIYFSASLSIDNVQLFRTKENLKILLNRLQWFRDERVEIQI